MANKDSQTAVVTLRPHHICCLRFWKMTFEDRGPKFNKVFDELKELLTQPNSAVMVTEGTDKLCADCHYFYEGHCASPNGGDEGVLKWDAILLRELGVPAGTCMTSGEWHNLIKHKIPFKLCQRCPWKAECSVGADLL